MGEKIDFGYQDIPKDEKAEKVGSIFSRVASRYDVMNDAMSLGLHRTWKRYFVAQAKIRPTYRIADLASGTGDIAVLMAPKIQAQGHITMSDINADMLKLGYNKIIDAGYAHAVDSVVADASALPFEDNAFDLVTMAFGLRNITDKKQALQEMLRIVKPGGRVMVMEFSRPKHALIKTAYDQYSFQCIPTLGEWIADDRDSYQYLVESIRRHPDQNTLQSWFYDVGYDQCHVVNILSGVVAIHTGVKL